MFYMTGAIPPVSDQGDDSPAPKTVAPEERLGWFYPIGLETARRITPTSVSPIPVPAMA